MRTKRIFACGVLLLLCINVGGAQITEEKKEEYTPEQKAKLKQAEELADKFVQRWHETWDFTLVFDEFFVTNPEYRRQNYYLFTRPDNCKECDDEIIKEGYLAFHNYSAMWVELHMAYGTSDEGKCLCPLKFLRASKFLERGFEAESENLKDREWLPKFILFTKRYAQIAKDVLPMNVLSSEAYRNRYLEEYGVAGKARISSAELLVDISAETVCYDIKRGVFEFFIIEENGVFKVLSLDRPE